MKNESAGDSSGGPAAETRYSQCRGPGSILGQGTRACMLQLRVMHASVKIKILRAAVKTQGSQINILKKKNQSADFSIRFISHIFFKGVIFIFRNAQPIGG